MVENKGITCSGGRIEKKSAQTIFTNNEIEKKQRDKKCTHTIFTNNDIYIYKRQRDRANAFHSTT